MLKNFLKITLGEFFEKYCKEIEKNCSEGSNFKEILEKVKTPSEKLENSNFILLICKWKNLQDYGPMDK